MKESHVLGIYMMVEYLFCLISVVLLFFLSFAASEVAGDEKIIPQKMNEFGEGEPVGGIVCCKVAQLKKGIGR